MNTNSYPIYRWDAAILGTSVYPSPIIYIKPDNLLLDFVTANNNAILVEILDTQSIYDGKFISGIVYKAENFPNCRQLLFKGTDMYIISLVAQWHSYPPSTGSCKIYGLKGGPPVNVDVDTGVPMTEIQTPNAPVFSDIRDIPQQLTLTQATYSKPLASSSHNSSLNTASIISIFIGISIVLFGE